MKFDDSVKTLRMVFSKNTPAILSGVATVGVVSTAVLAAKAQPEVHRSLDDATREKGEDLDKIETLQATWKHYIPAVTTGGATIVCIWGANTVSHRRQAALASAYAMAEKMSREYRAQVIEEVGEGRERTIRDEVAKKRIDNNPSANREITVVGDSDQLCYDTYSGRYFKSSVEAIRRTENQINSQIINEGYASLNEFFEALGLSPVRVGEQVGWNHDNLIDLHITAHLSDQNKPCLAIQYQTEPLGRFWKFN